MNLLKVAEVAKRLRITRDRAYRWAQQGTIPGVVRVGRTVRINEDELESWLKSGGDRAEPSGEEVALPL